MDTPFPGLRRCTNKGGSGEADPTIASVNQEPRARRNRRGFAVSKVKTVQKGPCPSNSLPIAREIQQRRACSGSKSVVHDDVLEDLGLPLGMSFAAVLSQVLDDKFVSRHPLDAEHLSTLCSSAVKESVSNIYGKRFDYFMRNFEKSFYSTLKTLQVIKASSSDKIDRKAKYRRLGGDGNKSIQESLHDEQENCSFSSSSEVECKDCSLEPINCNDNLPEHQVVCSDYHLALCGESNQQLVRANMINPGFNESVLTTFEKSVVEQTRSNDLKAVEIGLIMRKLQMKQSQLAMSSYSNLLERIKIRLNVSKAAFKEEKLRNQIKDTRHAELLRRCIDLLVSGLFLMCSFLIYGASIFSYQRITEAISPCVAMPRESKSWWMPKPMASFSSGWQMLRCQAVAITRMLFGLLMILVIAYSLFQRSAVVGPTMPVTFILLLLGVACGIAGKLCVDTLGGNGYVWLIYWEGLCLIHLFANIFPSVLHRLLYGRVLEVQWEKAVVLPYWIRRNIFYSMLLLIIPAAAGLFPFASVSEWKEHFIKKMMLLVSESRA
ncbi:hypothetical protein HPP92_005876 [Vanilla planifolia]|uniref:Protein CPR-5 n=1 Tax=Vanilla planifolia TaxID=51239 RepID=A0A835RL26_VANPL|nr:hypothetical protein HPP92_005876 [Vanilla planifolia]